MKKLALAMLVSAAAMTSAAASDLPRSAISPGFSSAVPVWTGFSAGVHLGAGFGGSFHNTNRYGLSNPSGVLGGLQAGYDYQIDRFVIGAATDISLASINRRFSPALGTTVRGSENWVGTLRARAGYAVQDNLLIYGTAGFAYGGVRVNETIGLLQNSQTRSLVGYTLGAGGEYMFTRNLAGLVEYRYTDFSRASYTAITGAPRVGLSNHQLRIGANYRF